MPPRIVLPLSIALLLAFTGAWAEVVDNPPADVENQASQGRQPVHWRLTNDRTIAATPPVPLPAPGKEPPATTSGRSGPVAADDFGARGAAGTGMIRPRGGAMSSPRQRAEREIRRLIRHLD